MDITSKGTDISGISSLFPSSETGIASQNQPSAGTISEAMLSEEDKERVNEIANALDIADVEQVIQFGTVAQRNISDFSFSVLEKVKSSELGDIGDSLKELTVVLNDTVSTQKKGVFGFVRKAKMGIDRIRAHYATAETNVNNVEQALRVHQQVLSEDIAIYQRMYELNMQYYKDLTIYIIAGKKALAVARSVKLKELQEKAALTQATEDFQLARDFEDLCGRFEKRLSDMELTRMISIQTAPQIRLLQNNDREMLDKIQASLSNTIPLWRNQLVLSLGIEHSRRSIEAQQMLSDKTNELLVRNAQTLKMAAVSAAREAERPVVDVDALERCNQALISSISEVMRIHEQGKEERVRIGQRLVSLEENLKQSLSRS